MPKNTYNSNADEILKILNPSAKYAHASMEVLQKKNFVLTIQPSVRAWPVTHLFVELDPCQVTFWICVLQSEEPNLT